MERCFGYAIDATGTLEVAPYATITVYDQNTSLLAAIYSDPDLYTPKANPFMPDQYGYFYFYAPGGRYAVRFSGQGITSAFTWGDILLQDTYQLARVDQGNTFVGNQTINGNLTVTGSGTFGGNALINSSGKIPALTSSYFASLSGANLTDLSATNLTSGTLPSARLSGLYSEDLVFDSADNVFSGASLSLGALPSTSGAVRRTYDEGSCFKNDVGMDTLLLKLGTSNKIEIGEMKNTGHISPSTDDTINLGEIALRYRNGHIKDLYTSIIAFGVSLVSTAGVIRLGNDTAYAIGFRTAADSANKLFYLNGADQFVLGSATSILGNLYPASADTYDIGSSGIPWRNLDLSGYATIASLKVGNGIQMQLSGGSYATLLDVNGSDQLVLGDGTHGIRINKALDVPNSGVATLNVLPAGATTFGGWLPLTDSSGQQIWIPCFV